MSTITGPEIYKFIATKRTSASMLDALKDQAYPENHYRMYREQLEKLSFKPNGNIHQHLKTLDNIVTKAKMCLYKVDQIHRREFFDLFFRGLPANFQMEIQIQNCKDVENAVIIIEGIINTFSNQSIATNIKAKNLNGLQNNDKKLFFKHHKWCFHTTQQCEYLNSKNRNKNSTQNNSKSFSIKESIVPLKSIQINENINNIDKTFTIDTGSHENIISITEAELIGLEAEKILETKRVQVADGNYLEISKKAKGNLFFEDRKSQSKEVKFLVADTTINDIVVNTTFPISKR